MSSLLVTPVALLALVAAPAQVYPITGPEASAAISAQIHRQVHFRLHAGFSGETHCTGLKVGEQEVTPTTQLAQWRCKLELRGVRFAHPCRAEANVFATAQPSHPRVQWLFENRFCNPHNPRHLSSRRS
jgi:hypothetical protein